MTNVPLELRKRWIPPLAVGTVLAAVVTAPLLHGGWTWMLDSVAGPHTHAPEAFFGLGGGVVQGIPVILFALQKALTPVVVGWLPFFVFFPLAMVGMSRVVDGRTVSKLGAGLFYCLTPIVYERLWVGHSGYLLAYALMPFVLRAIWQAQTIGGVQWLRVSLWTALATLMTPHFIWICLVLIVITTTVRRPSVHLWAGVLLSMVVAGLCSSYLLPSAHHENQGFTVGRADVTAYQTRHIAHEPLLYTAATMRGFWRQDILLPSNSFPGRLLLLLVGVAVVVIGAVLTWKRSRSDLIGILLCAVAGTLLVAGSHGPAGSLFLWAFDHVPGFAIMREPQKFAVLIALPVAYLFGTGVGGLSAGQNARAALTMGATTALIVPASLSPGIYWGYGNRLHAVQPPATWKAANESMGRGDGRVLVLPWHQYQTYPFLDGRIVSNAANTTFDRSTIVGDNVELPGLESTSSTTASRYLSYLFKRGPEISTFGALITPLNVQYIVLNKAVDWQNDLWLKSQKDLRVVQENNDLVLFENLDWKGSAYAVDQPITVTDWDALVAYSELHDDVRGVLVKSRTGTGGPSDAVEATPDVTNVMLTWHGRTTATIGPSQLKGLVVTGEPYYSGWSVGKFEAQESPQGTVMVPMTSATATLSFRTWSRFKLAYAISLVSAAGSVAVIEMSKRHPGRRKIPVHRLPESR